MGIFQLEQCEKCGVGIVNHYYVARMLAGVNGRDALYAKRVSVITPNPACKY